MQCALCDALYQKYRFVHQSKHSFCVVCKWPIRNGHVIVMPKRHVSGMSDLNEQESKDFLDLIDKMKTTISKISDDSPIIAINTGKLSTQEHIHMHIVPSKGGLRDLMSKYEGMPQREDKHDDIMQEMRDEILRCISDM